MTDSELAHYGVIGMRWGVRKNPDNAANKAIAKLRRYDSAYEKRQEKIRSLRTKSARNQIKSDRTISEKKSRNLVKRARRQNLKAAKLDKASQRYVKRGKKWVKQMNKVLSDKKYSDVSKDDIAYARRWLVTIFD